MTVKSLKILHIQKAEIVAGCENHLLTLLPYLRDRGYDVTMLVLTPPHNQNNEFVQQMRLQDIHTEVLPIRGYVDPQLLIRLIRFIGKGQYDFVHTHLIHADLYGCLAARLAGTPWVCSTRHNDDAFRRRFFWRWLMSWNAQYFDRLICISEHVRQFTETIEAVPKHKLVVIPYGFSTIEHTGNRTWRSHMNWDEQTPVLGNVARLTSQKGQATLLQALPQVLQQFPRTQLIILGDGELRLELQALANTFGIANHVHFLGYQADAAAWMANFDVLVHPSRWEGFGLVLLEAMAAKLPVIATEVSAIPEIVRPGETGLLVPSDNPCKLAQAICSLLSNRSLAQQMGMAGFQRLQKHFTVSAMVDRTHDLYDKISAIH